MMMRDTSTPQFAFKKDDFISITLEMPSIKQTKKKQIRKQIKEKVIKPIVEPVEADELNIEDLFSDVATKNIIIKKDKPKRIDAKRLQEINKKIETTKENRIEKIEKVQEINSQSSATEVNEYLAKIQLRVYESFHPPANSQGHTVKAVIELNALGKVLDFRILVPSSNSALNEECDKIKERLLGINFPINPDNVSGSYIIKLTSKE